MVESSTIRSGVGHRVLEIMRLAQSRLEAKSETYLSEQYLAVVRISPLEFP